jgi:hypothetical protein
MTEENKLKLDETKDVHAFAIKFLQQLAEHKQDDGKIDAGEWMQTAITTAPAGAKALLGVQRVDDELKDLTDDELKEVAKMGVEVMQAVLAFFMPSKDEK